MAHNRAVSDRPLILVNGTLMTAQETGGRPALKLYTAYADHLAAVGAVAVALPPLTDRAHLEAALEAADGLLLTGGDDFQTEPLGLGPMHREATPTPIEKQEEDLFLARYAIERKLPVLGICYGMQALGLVEGATMHQHLPEACPGIREHTGSAVHPVQIEATSKLSEAMDVDGVPVVSRHHQALDRVPAPWRVVARDADDSAVPGGIVEAIERADHPFAGGVQWHPELSEKEGPHGRLFEAFIAAAREFRAERAHPQSRS